MLDHLQGVGFVCASVPLWLLQPSQLSNLPTHCSAGSHHPAPVRRLVYFLSPLSDLVSTFFHWTPFTSPSFSSFLLSALAYLADERPNLFSDPFPTGDWL